MNKAQLVEKVAEKAQITKVLSEQILDVAMDVIQGVVAGGEDVKLVGFGTFMTTRRKARNGRNPKTGHAVAIPESIVPRFKPGKEFRTKVSEL